MTAPLGEGALASLVCPVDRTSLRSSGDGLTCADGHTFPVVEEVPVLLHPDLAPTLPDVFEATRTTLSGRNLTGNTEVGKAFVRDWIVRTNGNLYRNLAGPLPRYPIPSFPLAPRSPGETFLDVGGNWGRWAIAAARRGFTTTVVDPNLEAALVGGRIASELGVDVRYVVGDARALPIGTGTIGTTFSYSVLQHLDKLEAKRALTEMARALEPSGRSLVQMPNVFGLRQATNLVRQRVTRNTNPFRVRYWTPRELAEIGASVIGRSSLAVDGFFSLNPRPEDQDLLPPAASALVGGSEALKRLSSLPGWHWLRLFADSLWLLSERP